MHASKHKQGVGGKKGMGEVENLLRHFRRVSSLANICARALTNTSRLIKYVFCIQNQKLALLFAAVNFKGKDGIQDKGWMRFTNFFPIVQLYFDYF